jgi:hypothetical protein
MRRLFALGLLVASASLSMGCAACCSPYDYAYGYQGGAWQRDDLCHGRVGSAFTPAGSKVLVDKKEATESESAEPNQLPGPGPAPEAKPEKKPETKPDNMTTEARPLKSVKRARPVTSPPPYLPR